MLFGASIVLLCFSNWNKNAGKVSIVYFINKTDVTGSVPAVLFSVDDRVLKAIIMKKTLSIQCLAFLYYFNTTL